MSYGQCITCKAPAEVYRYYDEKWLFLCEPCASRHARKEVVGSLTDVKVGEVKGE